MKVLFGGGLGNQMFLYSFIFSQIQSNHVSVESIEIYMNHNPYEDPRKYALTPFSISLPLVEKNDSKGMNSIKYMILFRRIINKALTIINKQQNLSYILQKFGYVYSKHIFEYKNLFTITDKTILIEGAFQSPRYFERFKQDLQREFTVKICPSKENQQMLEQIESCNSVCVHVRRGDFLNNAYAKSLAVCDKNYYETAVEKIKERIQAPVFFVFSNSHEDIEWIKANYRFEDSKVVYVDLNNCDYEELRLMYTCKHFIISNSTFSWWAQFLSKNDKKVVIAPSVWTKTDELYKDSLYMSDWIRLCVGDKND